MTEMQVRERVERKLEKSGRITPRQVLEAYEETGLRPIRRVYRSGDRACAFGVLMTRKCVDTASCSAGDQFINAVDRKAGYGYSIGFFYGFDGESLAVFAGGEISREPDELTGWRDGRRASRFVFGEVR